MYNDQMKENCYKKLNVEIFEFKIKDSFIFSHCTEITPKEFSQYSA